MILQEKKKVEQVKGIQTSSRWYGSEWVIILNIFIRVGLIERMTDEQRL